MHGRAGRRRHCRAGRRHGGARGHVVLLRVEHGFGLVGVEVGLVGRQPAHARSRGMTVVTNDTREFARVPGLRVVDWLAARSWKR